MELMIPLVGLLVVALGMLLYLAVRPSVTRAVGGKVLAFLGIFLLPALALALGFEAHVERAKTKEFCTSCHVMEPYGKTLLIKDTEYVPAVHYQNNLVDREHACFTCHTDYALFGGFRAKLRGLRHLTVQYLGTVPDTVKLYTPFNNRECLHCHNGTRRFLAEDAHTETDTTLTAMQANRLSCMSSGCHDAIHDAKEVDDQELWKEPTR